MEANALEHVHSSARLAFYQTIFLPAFQSTAFDTEPLNNNNGALADYSQFRPFIENTCQFEKILQQVYSETSNIAKSRKRVEKTIRIKAEVTTINQIPIKTEPNKVSIKMEADEKKRKRNDVTIRKCQISSANELFECASKRRVCERCLISGAVVKCAGKCNGHFHKACNGNANICQSCDRAGSARCFACGNYDNTAALTKCGVKYCEYSFHMECLALWPQSHCTNFSQVPKICCPRHVCHTCVAFNTDLKNAIQPNKDLMHCIRCPATYHRESACIPAGTTIISTTQIQCIRHQAIATPERFTHCAVCARSGSLLSCQSCPLSVHKNCAGDASSPLTCTRCISGRLPLYGEIVWVKYVHYAWWPGECIIFHPQKREKRFFREKK